jgi:hypothetical protein
LHSSAGVSVTFCLCFWANAVPWAATREAPLMTYGLKLFINVKAAWQLLGYFMSPFAQLFAMVFFSRLCFLLLSLMKKKDAKKAC